MIDFITIRENRRHLLAVLDMNCQEIKSNSTLFRCSASTQSSSPGFHVKQSRRNPLRTYILVARFLRYKAQWLQKYPEEASILSDRASRTRGSPLNIATPLSLRAQRVVGSRPATVPFPRSSVRVHLGGPIGGLTFFLWGNSHIMNDVSRPYSPIQYSWFQT